MAWVRSIGAPPPLSSLQPSCFLVSTLLTPGVQERTDQGAGASPRAATQLRKTSSELIKKGHEGEHFELQRCESGIKQPVQTSSKLASNSSSLKDVERSEASQEAETRMDSVPGPPTLKETVCGPVDPGC